MKPRLAKKKYLNDIYGDIEAMAFVALLMGIENDPSHANVNKHLRLYINKLKGTHNPYFKATRLSSVRKLAIDFEKRRRSFKGDLVSSVNNE